jgi:glycosyltransferase involved in cell wall biosynthesis
MNYVDSKSSAVILSPRAIAFNHGTGAQLMYLLDEYRAVASINYGFYEKGIDDRAGFLESPWHRYWPWALRGRGFIAKANDYLPLAVWRNNRLTKSGRGLLRRMLNAQSNTHCVAVIHDNTCAKRINSIFDAIELPYKVVLYDFMHLDTPSPSNFPELARCVANAMSVYAISEPLREAALSLGANQVESISFYRPRQVKIGSGTLPSGAGQGFRILVVADAKPDAFDELLFAVTVFRREFPDQRVTVEVVGNAKTLPLLNKRHNVDVRFHGFVSSSRRDEIAAACDIAFLAGSTLSPQDCPLVKYSIPSKLGDYAAFGLPVVARLSARSAAEVFIREEANRFILVATVADEVLQSLRRLINDRNLVSQMRKAALGFADDRLYLPNATTDALMMNGTPPTK